MTKAALEELIYVLEHGEPQPGWRPKEIVVPHPHNWPVQQTPEFCEQYGEEGYQIITIELPYTLKQSYDLRIKIGKTTCHQKVTESLMRILIRVIGVNGEKKSVI